MGLFDNPRRWSKKGGRGLGFENRPKLHAPAPSMMHPGDTLRVLLCSVLSLFSSYENKAASSVRRRLKVCLFRRVLCKSSFFFRVSFEVLYPLRLSSPLLFRSFFFFVVFVFVSSPANSIGRSFAYHSTSLHLL